MNMSDKSGPRELTREERREIKRLVADRCANYSRAYGCLPLDYGCCYMIDKWWTGSYCKYFQNAVLPLNAELERALLGERPPAPPPAAETKPCKVCGKPFMGDGRQRYCSDKCANKARRSSEAGRSRKYRNKKKSTVTGMPF
ncbi:hypothetical protein FACS1894191_1970 [Clostridia bacterium]|nr:hypothetical protein FACS1894191_1970 [Clostridia bacterium]